jgi:predicted nucleic acid-binding protein
VEVILLDTSALVESLSGARRSFLALVGWLERGELLGLPALVLYEWLSGPRTEAELALQRQLFPDAAALPFGPEEAALSAELYRTLPRARSRVVDFGIAACALRRDAGLWTLDTEDFADIPGLKLARPDVG